MRTRSVYKKASAPDTGLSFSELASLTVVKPEGEYFFVAMSEDSAIVAAREDMKDEEFVKKLAAKLGVSVADIHALPQMVADSKTAKQAQTDAAAPKPELEVEPPNQPRPAIRRTRFGPTPAAFTTSPSAFRQVMR